MVNILGIYFSVDMESQERINYKEILSKIKKLLTWCMEAKGFDFNGEIS